MTRIGSQTHETLLANAAQDHRLARGVGMLSLFGFAAAAYCAVSKKSWKAVSGSTAPALAGATASVYFSRRAFHTGQAAHRVRPIDPNLSYPELCEQRGWEELKVHPDQAGLKERVLDLPCRSVLSSDYKREREHFGINDEDISRLLTQDFDQEGFIPFFEQYGDWGVARLKNKKSAKRRFLQLPYRDISGRNWGRALEILRIELKDIIRQVNKDARALVREPLKWWNKHHEALEVLSEKNRNRLTGRFVLILDGLEVSDWEPYEGVTLIDFASLRKWDEEIAGASDFLTLKPRIADLNPSLFNERQILPRSFNRAMEICLNAPPTALEKRFRQLKAWFGIEALNNSCRNATSFSKFIERWSDMGIDEHFSELYGGLTPENQLHLKSLYLQNPPSWFPHSLGLTRDDVMEAMHATGYPHMDRFLLLCKRRGVDIDYSSARYAVLRTDAQTLSYGAFKAKHGLSWRGTPIDPLSALELLLTKKLEDEVSRANLDQLAELAEDCRLLGVNFSEASKRAAAEALQQIKDVRGLLRLPLIAFRQKWVSGDLEGVRKLAIAYLRGLGADERQALLGKTNRTYNQLQNKGLMPSDIRVTISTHQECYRDLQGRINSVLEQREEGLRRSGGPDRLQRLADTPPNRPHLERERNVVIEQFRQALLQLA